MDWTGKERLFFPQSQKCDGGTSKGVDWIGGERNGVERSGADRKGSSFRSRRNVTAELPKEWKGAERKGVERSGGEGKGSNQSPLRKLSGLFS